MDADDDEAKDATDKKTRLSMLLGMIPSPSRLAVALLWRIHIQVRNVDRLPFRMKQATWQ
jgi:hypothetical protein